MKSTGASTTPSQKASRHERVGQFAQRMGLHERLCGASMLDLLTESDVAERLRVSLALVRRWRLENVAPLS
jgi:hypothetical protein